MRRLALGLLIVIAGTGSRPRAWAQDPKPGAAAEEPAAPAEPTTDAKPESAPAGDKDDASTGEAPSGAARRSTWSDIVVVPRKAVLKSNRIELTPFSGVSVNDVLIRHYALGADLNYYLSDVFSVGIQGQYFIKERTDRESVTGLQFNRVSTLNRYKFAAALNFGYVPGYGKFTLFNKYIFHWDVMASAGVGVIRTEIIPRVPSDQGFSNNRITFNPGVGTRLFLSNWLSFNVSVRDYIFTDLFEPLNRKPTDNIEAVKKAAGSQFVNNVMVCAGVSMYFPMSFQYRTPR